MLKHLRQFLAPIAIMFFISKESDSWQIYGTVLLIPLMVYEAWRYFNLRYLIADGELIVREGVIFKNVRHVPLERIQSIDSTQNFLHRLLNVADVRVETAGNTEPEAELRVLSIEAREQLRGIVFSANESPPQEAEDKEAIQSTTQLSGPTFDFHLPAPELALLGLNPLKGLAILGVGLGLAGQLGLLESASIGGFF
ncbi:MAG: PH domain-containing protein, partial [Planctomycetota bacterium]|nr:PH domain-containing protein [Planctomycetota bacterium]